MHKKFAIVATAISLTLATPAHAAPSATGAHGQSISVATTKFVKESNVSVLGKGFDETIGIYLAYCVLPKKGLLPTPCGGGADMQGVKEASYWISSNAPVYGAGLAIPFQPGGRFRQVVSVTKKIGKFDCTKVKCAITVRSDHLHEGDRFHDLFIPITFTKK
ncbi:hypothetical protein [Candidatus Planktophila dulcis]|uniref:hypothetical protein n=1 Tax=Candidatus Planktophila dulcis TaxID=1884914 RepID=UPI003CF26700